MRIRESPQIETVMAMYEQEIHQDRWKPSFKKLQTMVRCYQCKGKESVQKEMPGREKKAQSSSPAPRPQTQNDGKRSSKGNAPRRQFSFRKQNQNACRQCRDGNCTNPRCIDHGKSRIKPEGCGYGHAQESGTTSDQATDHFDRRSVSGGMIVFNGGL